MKKQLLTAFIALAGLTANAQLWINQSVTLPYNGYINDMEVTDANTAWGSTWDASAASPYTQDYVRTIDGGNTWIPASITGAPAALLIANIWPIDADTCYVSMYSTTGLADAVYKTTNGGGTWAQTGTNMFTQASSFANVVYFWNASTGMVMGDPVGVAGSQKYELFLTSNAGGTWTSVPAANIPALSDPAEYGITNLFSNADGRIWFGTTYGDVYRSIDFGNNWTKSASGFPAYVPAAGGRQDITDIAFSDSLNGIITQTNATSTLIRKTTDGGLTWTVLTPSGTFFNGDVEGVPGTNFFVTAGSNMVGGFGSSFSSDGGNSWTILDTNTSHTSLDFLNNTTGYGGEFINIGGPGGAWKFNGTLTSGPLNDECAGALDITSMFGQAPGTVITTGPYDNTTASTGPLDPTTGFSCFGEPDGFGTAPTLDNTLWFTFVGDGGNYFIEAPNNCAGVTNPLADGDSQIAIYTGSCGVLDSAACNEDGPNATGTYYPAGLNFQTTAGVTYYMLVDGFNFSGTLSIGEFCLNVTSLTSIACGAANISSGVSSGNGVNICADSTYSFTTTGITAPNVNAVNGFAVIISSGDLTGSTASPTVPAYPGMVGGTGVINVGVGATQVVNLLNNGLIFPYGIYYFTPIVVGNAVQGINTNIANYTMDPACTYLGVSVMVNLLAPGDPLCVVGINDVNNNQLSAFVTVKDRNNFTLNVNAARQDKATVSIMDIAGRVVYNNAFDVNYGENSMDLNVAGMSAGTYIVKIETSYGKATAKLVKL